MIHTSSAVVLATVVPRNGLRVRTTRPAACETEIPCLIDVALFTVSCLAFLRHVVWLTELRSPAPSVVVGVQFHGWEVRSTVRRRSTASIPSFIDSLSLLSFWVSIFNI